MDNEERESLLIQISIATGVLMALDRVTKEINKHRSETEALLSSLVEQHNATN